MPSPQVSPILSKYALDNGGFIRPLLVDPSLMKGPSLSNPSVYVTKAGRLMVNIRNLNYVLYHSERGIFEHSWGPLVYLHREIDQRLVTDNIICGLGEDFSVSSAAVVDTCLFDEEPIWKFVGLEDGRLVEWGGRLYLSGVRRDTKPDGQGRMELSDICLKRGRAIERSRARLPSPGDDSSYCEKNWMPVLDMDYTYVKWTNPTEVVEVDPEARSSRTVFLGEPLPLGGSELRGGSQVITFGGHRLAVVHEANLFKSAASRKNAVYTHRFVVWDMGWKIVEVSEPFSFMGGKIEFCCGLAEFGGHLIASFGFQDNAAFLLGMTKSSLGGVLKTYA